MSERSPLVYVACPYSDPDPNVRIARFAAVTRYAAKLMREGFMVFSPISMCHPMQELGGLPGEFEFWRNLDQTYLNLSWKLVVLKLPGWRSSVGVQGEIKLALERPIEIEYVEARDTL